MTRPRTRRRALQVLGTGLAATLAGCGGGGSRTDAGVSAEPPGSPALDAAGTWPSRRYDATNAAVADGTGLPDIETYWILDAGDVPVVADGALYNWQTDASRTALTRRESGTAAAVERVSLGDVDTNGPPTVAAGGVYGTDAERAYRVDVAGDAIRWRGPEMSGIEVSPTVADGVVYVRTGGDENTDAHLRALDAETGATRWRHGTRGEASSPVAVADDTVSLTDRDGLHALDTRNGETRWHRPLSDVGGSTPVVSNETVFVVDDAAGLVAVDARTGEERWRALGDTAIAGTPVVADDAVHVGGDPLVSLDPSDGRVATEFEAAGRPVGRRGGTLYAVDRDTLRAFDVADGRQRWWYGTGSANVGDTVVRGIDGVTPVDGAVYVSAADGLHGIGRPQS
ncbi:outer membrane protein assembly factor BamB [Halarchaeum rubridurum]|uniref:Outer membrane protein assembly factor BamB n=1 Tax=Halarchaeum rubridurum TaxID=489911 RepID=A0A8T4GKE2_9EURY|nr:PQQ-binding-like beta-propeller repeat protein [Halarchaeum rubridurum]MBP1953141.1 outer membrane protein assembly factor BamB [Halarchaeum rubridurum]